jgi:hypothetical protein
LVDVWINSSGVVVPASAMKKNDAKVQFESTQFVLIPQLRLKMVALDSLAQLSIGNTTESEFESNNSSGDNESVSTSTSSKKGLSRAPSNRNAKKSGLLVDLKELKVRPKKKKHAPWFIETGFKFFCIQTTFE